MAKFIGYGVVIEEPKRTTTTNGVDCIEVIFEEKNTTATGREIISTYSVAFLGQKARMVPENMRLAGATIVVEGSLRGRRSDTGTALFVNMYGDNLKIVSSVSPIENDVVASQGMDSIDLPDDDLPF